MLNRDLLLDILASGAAFKGEITLKFDLPQEAHPPKFTDVEVEEPIALSLNEYGNPTGEVVKPKSKKKRRPSLSKEQVWQIRRLCKTGISTLAIAEQTNVDKNTVWRIRNNKAYLNIGEPPVSQSTPTKVHAGFGVVKQ